MNNALRFSMLKVSPNDVTTMELKSYIKDSSVAPRSEMTISAFRILLRG